MHGWLVQTHTYACVYYFLSVIVCLYVFCIYTSVCGVNHMFNKYTRCTEPILVVHKTGIHPSVCVWGCWTRFAFWKCRQFCGRVGMKMCIQSTTIRHYTSRTHSLCTCVHGYLRHRGHVPCVCVCMVTSTIEDMFAVYVCAWLPPPLRTCSLCMRVHGYLHYRGHVHCVRVWFYLCWIPYKPQIWTRLGMKREDLDQWTENCRKVLWLHWWGPYSTALWLHWWGLYSTALWLHWWGLYSTVLWLHW